MIHRSCLVDGLADESTAQAIQLYTEYDPQPPFDSGSMAGVSPEVLERVEALGLASPEVLRRAREGVQVAEKPPSTRIIWPVT